jgi:hypothetical protein
MRQVNRFLLQLSIILEPVNALSIDGSRYTSCNQAKLEQIVKNPTGLLTKKGKKLPEKSQLGRSLTGSYFGIIKFEKRSIVKIVYIKNFSGKFSIQ